ncbi:hypothetical protein [Nafulsella turpanensis]|uniref:hypothetical protein n=1 Tax=Nafulsella turpanensis TaxID=1265690 RepID=UPI0003495827|nr:hypothetical protein [Nafulsella turpanensis]
MKKILPFCLLAFLSVAILSCKPEEELPLPENVMESDAGLKFRLEWNTGSTPEKAIEEADLDLFLLIGHDTAGESAWYDFEETALKSFYADGTYILQIDAFKISKATHYTLHVSTGGGSQLKTFEGTFEAGDELSLNFMEVTKSGTRYSLRTLLDTEP